MGQGKGIQGEKLPGPEMSPERQAEGSHVRPVACHLLSTGRAPSCGRRSRGMRLAAGAARRRRCCTSWRTLYPLRAASARTWTRPPSCASQSATCACTASALQVSPQRPAPVAEAPPLGSLSRLPSRGIRSQGEAPPLRMLDQSEPWVQKNPWEASPLRI